MNAIEPTKSKWAGRFIWASVIEGLLAVVWVLFVVNPISYIYSAFSYFSPAMVIASGSAGTWFFVGFASFLMVGVLGVAVTALFYHYIEVSMKKPYNGLRSLFAWSHLTLMTVGVTGATFLMMYGGYMGGKAMAATSSGGLGESAGQVHVTILGALVQPIGIFILIACLGVLLGGLGYILASRQKS